MYKNNGSSSSQTSPHHSKTRNDYKQQNSRNHNNNHNNYNDNNKPLHYLENIFSNDWKLFIWLSSLKQYEHYIYLFIAIWDIIKPHDDNVELFNEFINEIDQMKSYIEDLFANRVINKREEQKYSSLLDEYRDDEIEIKKKHVSCAYAELEKSGFESSSKINKQLCKLKPLRIKLLRQMVLNRMDSFIEISRKTRIVNDEENDLSLDDPIELQKEIESLRKQNTVLVEENSNYQALLGNMKNTRLSDHDPNNATKLTSDIVELQHLISEFTIVQGPEYKINEEKSIKLFSHYNCQVDFSSPKAKLMLGGILQRCIIEQILTDVYSYFKKYSNATEIQNPDDIIEVDILNATDRLIQSINYFNEKRPGKDYVTQTTPIKVRQQIHAALGCRGFLKDHPLIIDTAKRICNAMNVYRQIVDQDILNEIKAQSIQITHEVTSIFYFRLKTQQIIPTYHFFQSGDEIDIHLMQGAWSREDAKKLEVEVCYFPCIGVLDKENLSNQKIFTKAQVYTRLKKQNSSNDGYSNVF
ncbi:hypothetical protein C1645_854335 [Glomus cerebriforme]|uniref:Uncharacterized protein n=1 Tax=Glomus cerebriforme TaxID=658196 RepID=A0A397SN56_9GLOM|nr:hypothetical protein C1645_854335 [Glomus cerebriforme]